MILLRRFTKVFSGTSKYMYDYEQNMGNIITVESIYSMTERLKILPLIFPSSKFDDYHGGLYIKHSLVTDKWMPLYDKF